MLNKDHNKRPNLFEVSKIPCVRKSILKFVEENNCREDVIEFLDVGEESKAPTAKASAEPEVKNY